MTHFISHRRHGATPASVPAIASAVAVPHPDSVAEYPKTGQPESFAVFDALSDIVCITTFDGTLRFLNRAGRDLLGYLHDDALLLGCVFPTHTPAARELLLDEVIPAALRTGSITADTALQTADGRVFPASQTVLITPIGAGPPLTLTIIIRNVSIERQAGARLRESQRLFEMIAHASPDLIYLYDPTDERIVWMNRCPHAFLGGAERDARTLSRTEMFRLIHPDDRAQFRLHGLRMAAAFGDSDTLASELRMRTSGGPWRWMHTRASVFSRRETGAPLLLLGIATDISARKKTEHAMLVARDQAEQAAAVKNHFLSRVSIEFRDALQSIVGSVSAIHANRDRRLTARELEELSRLMSRGTQLLHTISELHDYTRIDAGELPVTQTLVDVRHVIRESAHAFDDHPAIEHVPIVLDLPEQSAPLLTDPARLRQTLTELIANAFACTERGNIVVTLLVEGERHTPIAIEVRDCGTGIAPEQQEQIFEPFEAATCETGSSVPPRTGLGLALARAVAEMIGCTLDFARSAPGRGSVFRIGLPAPSRAAQLAAEFLVPGSGSRHGREHGNAERGSAVISSM